MLFEFLQGQVSPVSFAAFTVAIILAITVHEFAHAYVADRAGDPTPRSQGRVSLNPAHHLDPIGTVLLFIAGFGWGRPVMVNPFNFRRLRRDYLLVSAAGPLSNVLLAAVAAGLFRLSEGWGQGAQLLLFRMVSLNVVLAVFNMIPLPPLDGSKVVASLLPSEQGAAFESFVGRFGLLLLIILLVVPPGNPLVGSILGPPHEFIVSRLLGWR